MDWDKIKGGAKDLAEKGMEVAKEKKEQKKQEEQELKERIAQMDRDGTVYFPKCYSTQVSANKRGFSLGQAIVASPVAGLIGKNKVEVTCLKCGHKWKAGKK